MKTTKKVVTRSLMYLIIIFTIMISIFPVVWVIMSAFKTNSQILSEPFSIPTSINLEGFQFIFENYNFGLYMLNSLVVAITSTLISVLIYSMAGYVFAKYEFPLKNILYALFIITLLVPAQSKAQPIFSLLNTFNINNTLSGLIFVYISLGMAMSMFILRNAFATIPDALNEAASIEGATFFQKFWKVNLPLAKNGVVTSGILMFLANWNEYFYASLLTSSEKVRTLPVALQFFNETFSYNYTRLFAALTIVILPGIILYTIAQEKIQESFASSGIK